MVFIKPQLSVWERAAFAVAIFRTFANGFYNLLTRPFKGSSGSAKYSNHVRLAMLRTLLAHTTPRQQQALNPTLGEIYPIYAKKAGFKPEHITLADGTKGYWIGNPSAKKIIIWFHGGGYNLPPDPGHLLFASSIVSTTGPSLAVLMFAYTLAPHEIYPHQLRQAVECVRYAINNLHLKPENISIGGDSAGANLAIGVLSHLMHPHKDLTPLKLEGRLGTAILLAPWCSFRTDWPSFRYNAYKDLLSAPCCDAFSQIFLGGKDRDSYNEPLAADESWWKSLESVVAEILVAGGSDEILIDSIRELARQFEAVHKNVTVVIGEGEWHDMPVVQALHPGGQQDAAIKSFVRARL